MKFLPALLLRLCCLMPVLVGSESSGFDYSGHRLINQLALASLPDSFPGFVRESKAAERMAFLAGEPDRWRNTPDNTLRHFNKPDHYLDVEYLAPLGFDVESLPPFRYQFTMQLGEARRVRGNKYPTADPGNNRDHTKEHVGFLPWSIAEYFSKLKSAFSYLKAYDEGGTAEEVANARLNVIQFMGEMGHFVGDAAQPLHTTKHFNGWLGVNPKGYTMSRGFHSWIDGGYINKVGLEIGELTPRVRPARVMRSATVSRVEPGVFSVSLKYVLAQHQLVEPLYQLDKKGALTPGEPNGLEGKKFFEQQYLAAAQMLGDLWLTAWKESPPDSYLQSYLARQKLEGNNGDR